MQDNKQQKHRNVSHTQTERVSDENVKVSGSRGLDITAYTASGTLNLCMLPVSNP